MAELIECRECNERNCQGCNIHTLATMLHAGKLKSIMSDGYCIDPFAEVHPVRHGHNTGNARIFECSECGYGYDDIYLTDELHFDPEEINYCPNCGATMDKENDNG